MRKPTIPKQFLGAFKAGHRASAREFIDEEYSYTLLNRILDSNWSDKESIEALTYLTKFNNEYHKKVVKKGEETDLHDESNALNEYKTNKYGELIRDKKNKPIPVSKRNSVINKNNATDRDLMSRMKHKIQSIEPSLNAEGDFLMDININQYRDLNHEDTLIELLDAKRLLETPDDPEN